MKEDQLARGRLRKGLAKEVLEYITLPFWRSSHEHLFRPFSHINIAHVIMLEERKILDRDRAAKILRLLLDIEDGDPQRIQPGVGGEFYLDLEKYIINQLGEDIGGRMHTGRSRNDLIATGQRMALREPLDHIIDKLLELRRAELEIAEKHIHSVMPGYTHMQHAQPITLAHYFVGHAGALNRDTRRLENAHTFLELCPLGTGALAGVTFPIDRYRQAELLGFRDILLNALDAVASRDYVFDIAAGLAMTACDLSRLAEDLYLWNTYEFGFIDMGEEYSEISSIMPQKKNPFILEHCRGRAGKVIGSLQSVLTSLKGTPFTHSRDVSGEAVAPVWDALEASGSVLAVMPGLLRSLTFQTDRMKKMAGENFSTVTDLVDLMVKEKNLSFRTAHHIVARVVDRILQGRKKPEDITSAVVDEAAVQTVGHPLQFSEKQVKDALLPEACVTRRNLPGGPAPEEMKRMIEKARKELGEAERNLEQRRSARKKAEQILLQTARRYLE